MGEVIKAAGLTHGAFYAHFGSKEELQAAAVTYRQSVSRCRVQRSRNTMKRKAVYVDRYLRPRHRVDPGDGCSMAALAQEVARSTPELKAAFEQGFEKILSAKDENRKEAIFQTAAMVGGVVVARGGAGCRLSEEILESVRRKDQLKPAWMA